MNRRISIVTLMGLLFFGISVPSAISTESTPSPSAAGKAAAKVAIAKAAAVKAVSQSCVGCTVGKVGPGGGIVFYDAGSRQKWGRYLEAAPANWSGSGADPKTPWCNITNASLSDHGNKVFGMGIGQGRSNTRLIRAHCSSGAGVMASAYRGGGKSDWFLPSKDELNMMYADRTLIGGLAPDNYWSSSEDYALASWFQSIADGSTGSVMKYTTNSVRPIRVL